MGRIRGSFVRHFAMKSWNTRDLERELCELKNTKIQGRKNKIKRRNDRDKSPSFNLIPHAYYHPSKYISWSI